MDLHKPKSWHGWREFLKEYAIIVVGVATALAAEQAVEWWHWKNQVTESRALIATEGAIAAQIIAYIGSVGDMAAGTGITSIRTRVSTASGSVPIAWPTTEYNALRAIVGSLPELGGYAATFGSGNPTAVGSSILVNEYTAVPSRATRGRHYRPWMSVNAQTNTGEVSTGFITGITGAYRALFLGVETTVVHSATAGDTLIRNVTVSSGIARLKTRTR